ncbi:SPOR domain-containing protein [Luteimonas qiangzhengi]|uniref:SPOR domain-containing protein n=1 Tax=Luteimonas sp. MJ146 TaxID=3129240 RepID=UPI0031BA60BD
MAARKGRSQARRNSGNGNGLPGWAWMLIGILVAVIAILVAPRFFKSEGEDGFYRPRANPDATPAQASSPGEDDAPARPADPLPAPTSDPEYDFYTLLPGQEVRMTDAELAASAKAEQERERQAAQRNADAAQAADTSTAAAQPPAAAQDTPATPATPTASSTAAAAPAADTTARFLLQAGSFSASGDAEALKARIALLGLGARVESAQVQGRTVYRVRMGPYGTASDLAEAKGRLENGGLDAMAIRVQ